LGELTAVHEAGQLMMELEPHAANLLGFEHTRQSESEWLQVKNLREMVKAPDQIVTLTRFFDVRKVNVGRPFTELTELHERESKEHGHKYDDAIHQDILISYKL
jgi:hypothetical protein